MALDPLKYDIAAFDKARATFNTNAAKGKIGTFNVNDYLLPGKTSGTVAGTATGGGGLYGGKPDTVDPNAAAGGAIAGNLANFDDLTKLTTKTNDLLADEYTSRFPNYAELANQNSLNIGAQLRGELPQDVVNLIGQQAAERGVGGGVSGSQFSNSDYLRSLGLTSIGQQKTGADNYSRSLGDIKNIPIFDPTTMFTHADDIYNAGNRGNDIAALPDPNAVGANNVRLAMEPINDQKRIDAAKKWEDDRRLAVTNQYTQPGSMVGLR